MTPDKEEIYKNATLKILATIDKMNMDKIRRMRAKNLALYFRDSFKLPNVKHDTFWVDLGKEMEKLTYDSDGFCRASSVNFALMMGGEPEWKLMYIDKFRWDFGPHHYLLHTPSKTVLDLTYDQYTNTGISVPYSLGKPTKLEFRDEDIALRFAEALQLSAVLGK